MTIDTDLSMLKRSDYIHCREIAFEYPEHPISYDIQQYIKTTNLTNDEVGYITKSIIPLMKKYEQNNLTQTDEYDELVTAACDRLHQITKVKLEAQLDAVENALANLSERLS